MNMKFLLSLAVLFSGAAVFAQNNGTMDLKNDATGGAVHRMDIARLFDYIDEGSVELREQTIAVEAANEGLRSAKTERLPSIGLEANVSYNGDAVMLDRDFGNAVRQDSPHFGNQFSLDVQQVLYAGGAINAGVRMAELGVAQAGLGEELTRQNLRFVALGQYLDLQRVANRIQVLEKNIELTDTLIENIKDRCAEGTALQNDVTRYELQRQSLLLNLTQLSGTRRILNNQLCNTLGLDPSDTIEPTEDCAGKIFESGEEALWQNAALSNPAMRMAEIDEQIAAQKETLARSDKLPKFAIVANNSLNGPIFYELPPVDKNINVWYVGLGVQYSLSSLYKGSKTRQAAVERRRAQEHTAVVSHQVSNQVQAAYTEYLQSYVELETRQQSVRLANENYDVVSSRYDAQLVLVTDMIDAATMKLDAELGEADAKIGIAYAYYKMKYIAGQL